DPIALGAAHQRQTQSRVPCRRLDDGASGSERAVTFGGIDHRKADAVFDRAARVLGFQLEKQGTEPRVDATDAHQRGVADQFKYGRTG
nr:hypothetical protein [Tanacetum cinerariifolium]